MTDTRKCTVGVLIVAVVIVAVSIASLLGAAAGP
jgi:hypothetical protein